MERGPIIIGGPDRCGKTLLRALLVSHPNIAIPEVGSNLWTYFYGQHGDLSRVENFERCLAAMLRYKHVRLLDPDPERIRREFWQGPPTYARLFELFHVHYAQRLGKPRWGDQTGLIERYADEVFAAYPAAKMIHVIRDPRDRYEASLALWPNGRGRVGGATARWLYSAGLAERNLRRYPDRYKVVRYETLVSQPEATLREICAFLGERYTPAMLTMDGAPRFREQFGAHPDGATEGSQITTAYVGRFRGAVPRRELAFMQLHARRQMAAHGYDPEPLGLSAREKLLFWLIDWPTNLTRMVTWRAFETVQHNLPGVVGRRPAPKMVLRASTS